MELEASHLIIYFIIWTIFYFFLSQYISSLSRDKWITYVQSEESDDMLVEALQAVIEEIEIRMDEKLQTFTGKFFGSIGEMTRRAQEMNPVTDLKKAMKQGDWGSVLLEYALNKSQLGPVLDNLKGLDSGKPPPKQGENPPKFGL